MDLFDKFQFNDYVKKTLNNIHFTSPTPIQDKAIPLVYKNKDIIGISQTGTGKTHSFLIPIIDRIDTNADYVQAVITTPTRELAHRSMKTQRNSRKKTLI